MLVLKKGANSFAFYCRFKLHVKKIHIFWSNIFHGLWYTAIYFCLMDIGSVFVHFFCLKQALIPLAVFILHCFYRWSKFSFPLVWVVFLHARGWGNEGYLKVKFHSANFVLRCFGEHFILETLGCFLILESDCSESIITSDTCVV